MAFDLRPLLHHEDEPDDDERDDDEGDDDDPDDDEGEGGKKEKRRKTNHDTKGGGRKKAPKEAAPGSDGAAMVGVHSPLRSDYCVLIYVCYSTLKNNLFFVAVYCFPTSVGF